MSSLDELTRAYEEEWLRIALCAEPADRPKTEAAITEIYCVLDLPKPTFKWHPSPFAVVSDNDNERVCKSERKYISVESRIANKLRSQVTSLMFQESFGSPPWDSFGKITQCLYHGLIRPLNTVLTDCWPMSDIRFAMHGQHEAYWVGKHMLGIHIDREGRRSNNTPHSEQFGRGLQCLRLWVLLAKHAGWWVPCQTVVFCIDRPCTQKLDMERRVLHCDDGPALRYPDGSSLWRLNGLEVDSQAVMRPENQTLEQIGKEPNAELKRIRIERYAGRDKPPGEGWMRYLRATGAVCIDRRRNDVENVEEALFETRQREMVLICTCPSTARAYALEVPNWCDTVAKAQHYLHSESQLDRNAVRPNVIGRS